MTHEIEFGELFSGKGEEKNLFDKPSEVERTIEGIKRISREYGVDDTWRGDVHYRVDIYHLEPEGVSILYQRNDAHYYWAKLFGSCESVDTAKRRIRPIVKESIDKRAKILTKDW